LPLPPVSTTCVMRTSLVGIYLAIMAHPGRPARPGGVLYW
jgi:hypothetical protein